MATQLDETVPIGNRRKSVVVGLLVFVLLGGLAGWWFFPDSSDPPIAFHTGLWKSPRSSEFREGELTFRRLMVKDLTANVLPGKCRQELESQLGPSESDTYFKNTGRHFIYNLGPEQAGYASIDSEWLLIWLNEEGCYVRHAIRTD